MPIHANHIRHIQQIIDHLLDFDTTSPEIFLEQIKQLQASLANHPAMTANDFYQLAKCIISPTDTLLKLEKCTAPATATTPSKEQTQVTNTIQSLAMATGLDPTKLPSLSLAEVQLFTAAYVENFIKQVAIKSGIATEDITLYDSISHMVKDHLLIEFKSEPFIMPVGEHPDLDLGDQRHFIYSARLAIHEVDSGSALYRPTLSVTTYLTAVPQHTDINLDDYSDFEFDTNANRRDFFRELRQEARHQARLIASDLAIRHLEDQHSQYIADGRINDDLRRLICHKRYWSALISGKILLEDFRMLDGDTMWKLLDPHVADLVTNHIITTNQVTRLAKHQLQLLTEPYLHQMVKSKSLAIETVLALRENRCKFISHPVILHLIKIEKLSFAQACRLPFFLVCPKNNSRFGLFSPSHVYSTRVGLLVASHTRDYFAKRQIDWSALEKIRERQAQFLLNPDFLALLEQEKFSLSDINQLSDRAIELIESIPDCHLYFAMHSLELSGFFTCRTEEDQVEMIAFIFSSRLYWLMEDDSLVERDNINNIFLDLTITKRNLPYSQYDIPLIQNLIIKHFLSYLHDEILSKIKVGSSEDIRKQLAYFNNQLVSIIADETTSYQQKLTELCHIAEKMTTPVSTKKQGVNSATGEIEPSTKRRKLNNDASLSPTVAAIYIGLLKIVDFCQDISESVIENNLVSQLQH
jgi:hypothetical protein